MFFNILARTAMLGVLLAVVSPLPSVVAQVTDPAIINWTINTSGATGSSVDADINELVKDIFADVESVFYTDDRVYINTSGVPSYMTGPFPDGNPAYPSDLDVTYQFPRSPTAAAEGTNVAVGLGVQGAFVNGVALYNFSDGMSYNNQGIWNQDANFFELDGFDTAPGHPSPIRGSGGGGLVAGYYHHHQNPKSLRAALGDDGSGHSPVLGFAQDGFPIYGPYGFDDPTNANSGVVRMESSYQLRDISDRTTLADGTQLAAALYGPSIAEVALGGYQEDYAYEVMSGHLDEHNGRFAITPDYPDGTYAYFVTINEDLTSAFPHIIGTTFYGDVLSQTNVTIPASAVQYVPEPTGIAMIAMGLAGVAFIGRRRRCG